MNMEQEYPQRKVKMEMKLFQKKYGAHMISL